MGLRSAFKSESIKLPAGNSAGEWVVGGATFLVTALFLIFVLRILWDVFSLGFSAVSWEFLTTDPTDGGRQGGIRSVLISTGWILGIAVCFSTPIAVMSAVWLSEFQGRFRKLVPLVRISLDVLAGIPSVVFGLAGYVFFCQFLGMGYSILSGGLTLACMILPLLIRILENSIQNVPDSYRLAAHNLGLSKTTTVFRVLLPQVMGGLITGIVLGTCRAVSETAALLFTSGSVDRMPESWLDSGRTLSIHVYELAMNPGGEVAANATAVVLIVIVLAFSSAASLFSTYWNRR